MNSFILLVFSLNFYSPKRIKLFKGPCLCSFFSVCSFFFQSTNKYVNRDVNLQRTKDKIIHGCHQRTIKIERVLVARIMNSMHNRNKILKERKKNVELRIIILRMYSSMRRFCFDDTSVFFFLRFLVFVAFCVY